MPTANINILAVIVAAVLTFVLGAVWYSPVLFAKQWMAAQGYTPEKLEEIKRKGVTRAYAVSVLCYLVTAYVMALLASYTNSTTLAQGLWNSCRRRAAPSRTRSPDSTAPRRRRLGSLPSASSLPASPECTLAPPSTAWRTGRENTTRRRGRRSGPRRR